MLRPPRRSSGARALLVAIAALAALATVSEPAAEPVDPRAGDPQALDPQSLDPQSLDPVRVYFDRGSCRRPLQEVEIWDRARSRWEPHPWHARILADSCNLEDAGYLLNEIRYRCVEPKGAHELAPWRVGMKVFHRGIVDDCSLPWTARADPEVVGLHIRSPLPGDVVQNDHMRIELEGSVQLGGRDARGYDVVVALDVSASTARALGGGGAGGRAPSRSLLSLEIEAARRLLEALARHDDPVRVALVTHSSALGDVGARVELPFTSDLARARATLARIGSQGSAGKPRFNEGLELATTLERSRRARIVFALADGRPRLPFGGGASYRPLHRQQTLELLARGAANGVTVHVLALGGPEEVFSELAHALAALHGSFERARTAAQATAALARRPLVRVEEVAVVNATTGTPAEKVRLGVDGHFSATVPVRAGENRLFASAVASNGRSVLEWLDIEFDTSLVRERLRVAERQRIHEERMQRDRLGKTLTIEVENVAERPLGR